jgi:nucleotide-binding universal stress UspA family protein
MAAMRDVVVHVNDELLSKHAVTLAASLAAELGAGLTALLVATPVHAGVGLSAETASLAQQLGRTQREALLSIGDRLLDGVQQRCHGLQLEMQFADGDPVEVLKARARMADLLVTSQRDPAGEGGLSSGQAARLLVGAACPVLCVPYIGWGAGKSATPQDRLLRRALVAWSDTRESARALRDALPLLTHASHVELVSFADAARAEDPSREASLQRVADYLGRHGVKATTTVFSQTAPSMGERMLRGWVPDVAVAEALLSHAADTQADFIVMGSYGHSRLRELVLGGVTRTMLETMTVPVLMSH